MTNPDLNKPSPPPSRVSLAALVAAPLLLLAGLWFVFTGGEERDDQPQALIGANSTAFSPEQRRAIEGIVKDYLVQNPEIFLEVQSALEIKMAKDEAERTKKMVAEHAKEIYRAPNAPVAGNPNGDITVVEFFDYNCGYCKQSLASIAKLIDADPKLRVS